MFSARTGLVVKSEKVKSYHPSRWAVCGIVLVMSLTANASEPSAVSLASAESAFAAHSVATNMREAFLGVLAADAILLRPHPVNGRNFIEKGAVPPIELNWRPVFVYASAAGDLGYSTGPWRILPRNADGTLVSTAHAQFGQFISVWQRQASGKWTLLIDHGIDHAQDELASSWLQTPAPVAHRSTAEALTRAEASFAETLARADYATALRQAAAKDIRVYRDATPPALGKLPDEAPYAAGFRTRNVRAAMAQSGDLGYALIALTPATVTTTATEKESATAYALHLWRARADGGLELVLDLRTNVPAPRR